MTQQDDITQRVLTDDEINDACDWPAANTTMRAENDRAMAREVEAAVLRKLRAPVAKPWPVEEQPDGTVTPVDPVDTASAPVANARAALAQLEAACDTLCRLRTQEQYLSMVDSGQQDALLALDDARAQARAALASAPVAGEAVTWEAVRQELAIFLMGATGRSSKEWHRPLDNASEGGALARMRACLAAPQASAEYERGHADGWAAGWDQAIKQPQADKDGGQQRAEVTEAQCFAVYQALDEFGRDIDIYEYGLPYLGDEHRQQKAVEIIRAALSAPQAEQGERDA